MFCINCRNIPLFPLIDSRGRNPPLLLLVAVSALKTFIRMSKLSNPAKPKNENHTVYELHDALAYCCSYCFNCLE